MRQERHRLFRFDDDVSLGVHGLFEVAVSSVFGGINLQGQTGSSGLAFLSANHHVALVPLVPLVPCVRCVPRVPEAAASRGLTLT